MGAGLDYLVVLGSVALFILIYFLIQTLISVQASLRRLDIVLLETESKLKKLTSFINTLENISDITEKESERLKLKYDYETKNLIDKDTVDTRELVDLLISGIKFGIKIFKRR
jgi:hypothetical protein